MYVYYKKEFQVNTYGDDNGTYNYLKIFNDI